MATDAPRQLGPSDKLPYASPFSYAKAIIKEDVTYPIVPNCPIINVDNPMTFSASNIPVGTFFIVHSLNGDIRQETLCLRVPNDTKAVQGKLGLWDGSVIIGSRDNSSSPGGGNMM